jgi:hypothetical protein
LPNSASKKWGLMDGKKNFYPGFPPHNEQAGWVIPAIEETGPSFKPKHSFGVVTKEQFFHFVAEFKGIKVF